MSMISADTSSLAHKPIVRTSSISNRVVHDYSHNNTYRAVFDFDGVSWLTNIVGTACSDHFGVTLMGGS